jgi:hypothetical protein
MQILNTRGRIDQASIALPQRTVTIHYSNKILGYPIPSPRNAHSNQITTHCSLESHLGTSELLSALLFNGNGGAGFVLLLGGGGGGGLFFSTPSIPDPFTAAVVEALQLPTRDTSDIGESE